MSKVSQSQHDLERQLQEQLELLGKLAELYDQGQHSVAKMLAVQARTLLHDTRNSKSLLGQLGLKNRKFISTTVRLPEIQTGTLHVGNYAALVGIPLGGGGADYAPNLDNTINENRKISFDEYWNEVIFIDKHNESFTRKDIILYLADQDGGAHVDPGLDAKYVELSRRNSLGWQKEEKSEIRNLSGVEFASMRQIAHELLKTLVEDYKTPAQQEYPEGVISAVGISLVTSEDGSKDASNRQIDFSNARRKGPCPCGSGKKYKRCHGS